MEISKKKSLSAIGSFYHNFGSKTGYFENSVHWFNIVLRQKLDITSNFYGANGLFHPVSGLKAAQSDCALLGAEMRHMESSKKIDFMGEGLLVPILHPRECNVFLGIC